MKVATFTAESAADAIAQIKAQLGPQAVVLNVRQLPANGLSRLWQKARIEVTAGVKEPERAAPDPLQALRLELAEIRQQLAPRNPAPSPSIAEPVINRPEPAPSAISHGWRVESLLRDSGLLPLPVQRVMDLIINRHGTEPPASWPEELAILRETMAGFWRQPSPAPTPAGGDAHVFVGPPGSGKTTALVQWMTQQVLLDGRSPRVWRLDGRCANTAESLSVHCEILGVPVERTWPREPYPQTGEAEFIDLPGISAQDRNGLAELELQLRSWPGVQVHLVLNAAYDSQLLLSQARAYSVLPVSDLILTHLDEESRWGKLWNLVLGTNFSLRFLCTGQNIPGDFHQASAEKILTRQFACK